jgi:NitT/TauT family transport system substrate-binding protein
VVAEAAQSIDVRDGGDAMSGPTQRGYGRRDFLSHASALGAGTLLGLPRAARAEPPPETARIRLIQLPTVCQAPQYVAEELLRNEGFTDVQYIKKPGATKAIETALASGEVDINMHFAAPSIIRVDAGDPVTMLAGLHVGCFELFATERVRALRDLRGKTIAILELGASNHVFLSSMLAYVGLDPRKDVNFETHPSAEAMQLLAEGKVDAFLGYPPEPQELRARKIGHVVVNSSVDQPWSEYFCCMVVGNTEFVRSHPVATKRALRAILKAADICAAEPARSAKLLVDRGYTKRYDYALQAVRDIPYNKWREYDPQDTIRFYALRLHEVGMIQASPQKIMAQGTDWRFLNELKKELKA